MKAIDGRARRQARREPQYRASPELILATTRVPRTHESDTLDLTARPISGLEVHGWQAVPSGFARSDFATCVSTGIWSG